MIKLTSIGKDGSNARVVWLNKAHIIGVEADDGVTMLWLTDGAQVYVAETVDVVVAMFRSGV